MWKTYKLGICLTKADIYKRIDNLQAEIEKRKVNDFRKTAAYYHKINELLERFRNMIEKAFLLDNLEDFWGYVIIMSYKGIELWLGHYSQVKNSNFFGVDQKYMLFRAEAKMLTVEEYATIYNIEPGTVRQWIRRGRMKSIIKLGNEWRISELTDLPTKDYKDSCYIWNEDVILDDEHEYMRNYNSVSIMQDVRNKSQFKIVFISDNREVEDKVIWYETKEKEKFELYCITNPKITYHSLFDANIEWTMLLNTWFKPEY